MMKKFSFKCPGCGFEFRHLPPESTCNYCNFKFWELSPTAEESEEAK